MNYMAAEMPVIAEVYRKNGETYSKNTIGGNDSRLQGISIKKVVDREVDNTDQSNAISVRFIKYGRCIADAFKKKKSQ